MRRLISWVIVIALGLLLYTLLMGLGLFIWGAVFSNPTPPQPVVVDNRVALSNALGFTGADAPVYP